MLHIKSKEEWYPDGSQPVLYDWADNALPTIPVIQGDREVMAFWVQRKDGADANGQPTYSNLDWSTVTPVTASSTLIVVCPVSLLYVAPPLDTV
jgi:hypothetical protein